MSHNKITNFSPKYWESDKRNVEYDGNFNEQFHYPALPAML